MDLVRKDMIQMGCGGGENTDFNERIKRMMKEGHQVYHFGFGESPFPVLEAAMEAIRQNIHQNSYLHAQGLPQLRKGICNFHRHYDNVIFDPEDVIVAAGSKELILLLMTVFGGEILIQSPAWATYRSQALLSRHSPIVVDSREEDGWRITPEGLEKAVRGIDSKKYKLLVLCNPGNPSGTCYTEEQLRELVETCRKHSILILSDEIYARIHFTGQHVCVSKVYPEGGILCTSMSKWAGVGGWRMGYHIYPKQLRALRDVVMTAGSHSYSCASAPMQYAFAEATQNMAACDDYIYHVRRVMKCVSEFCVRELRSAGVTVAEPRGGFFMFPNFEVIRPALMRRGITTGQAMCDAMLTDISVALLPGGPTHSRPVEELTARLSFVNFDGAAALAESRSRGSDKKLDKEFLREFCRPVHDGIMAIKEWVNQLTAEYENVQEPYKKHARTK